MLNELKAILTRASGTLLQDAMGASALIVMLMACLHLPTLF